MVVNFQSWLDPLIIIMALPGAFSGILWMLFATHTTFNVPSLMGTIMCIGVATSNSILLITFANDQRLEEGASAHDAALAAGTTRLRPVLMTALAMILGMIPMSLGLGEGGEQNAPLGRAVIGGLLFATATTLFFVPVIYSIFRRKEHPADQRRGRRTAFRQGRAGIPVGDRRQERSKRTWGRGVYRRQKRRWGRQGRPGIVCGPALKRTSMNTDHSTEERPMRRVPAARHEHDGAASHPAPDDKKSKKGGYGKFFLIVLGLVILLAILAVLGIINLFHNRHEQADTAQALQAGAMTVQAVKPTRSPPQFNFSLPGSTEALNTATLYARVNGYLKSRSGGHRRPGREPVSCWRSSTRPTSTRNSTRPARNSSSSAPRRGSRRSPTTAKSGCSNRRSSASRSTTRTRPRLNQAVANVKAAEANVQNLSAQQGFERITAPFTGVVTARFLDDGALITSGSGTTAPSIYTLVQSDILRVFIYVPQSYVANLHVGQEVSVSAPDYPQKVFKGRLTPHGRCARPDRRARSGSKSSFRARAASCCRGCI